MEFDDDPTNGDTMMSDFLNVLRTLAGGAGFFVPLLLLGLFFRPEECWKSRRATLVFGLISCGILLIYVICFRNVPVSRYFFVPVLLCCLFCGGGITGFLTKVKPSCRAAVLWSICILICAGSVLQIGFRGRKDYIAKLTQEIILQRSRSNKKGVILYSDQGDAPKVADLLARNSVPCELISVIGFNKKSFMVDLPALDLNSRELYVLTGVSKQQSADDWRKELQSCSYLTPFDLAAEAVYRKRRLLLWRFNGKVGGPSSAEIAALADTFPDEIHFGEGNGFRHIRICSDTLLENGKGFLFNYANLFSKVEKNFWQFYFQGQLMEQISFSCGNEFFWPTGFVLYQKTSPDTLKKTQTSVFREGVLPAQDPMLTYPCGNVIYPEHFVPDWSAFAVNQYSGAEYQISGTEKDGCFSGKIVHVASGKTADVEIPVRRQSLDVLKKSSLRILWISNEYSNAMDVPKDVALLAGDGVSVERCCENIFISHYKKAIDDFSQMSFPQVSPQIIVLDIFARVFVDKDFFEFQKEVFHQRLEQLLQQVRARFPDAQIMALLPPVPAKRELQLLRYREAVLMEEFARQYPQYRLWIIDPVGAANQSQDIRNVISSRGYSAPLVLAPEGSRKIAEVVVAHWAHYLSLQEKQKH